MTVWVAFPSAAPVNRAMLCARAWLVQGYKLAIACEDDRNLGASITLRNVDYLGYPSTINALSLDIFGQDPECTVVIAAGDDLFPDMDSDAVELESRFVTEHPDLLAVVQSIGDPWSIDGKGPQAARVAGSPWMGREWCRRAYEGMGPQCNEYRHYFADQELQIVATKLELFWHWNDVAQVHQHWMRHGSQPPEHIQDKDFAADREIFDRRKAAGFPGSGLERLG